jgi:hypothetical protein
MTISEVQFGRSEGNYYLEFIGGEEVVGGVELGNLDQAYDALDRLGDAMLKLRNLMDFHYRQRQAAA